MQSLKPIRQRAYPASSGPRFAWNVVAQGAALFGAFVFISAVVCGIL
ncbi:hypothetical protein [Pararhizobium antarcticum]|nr:hypothetical protein [Pararhizobium antarcticum]